MEDDPLTRTIVKLLEGSPGQLTPIGAGVLAAAHLGLARDSRSFARKLGLAHALVIRECVSLAEDLALLVIDDRSCRSQRVFYALSERGEALVTEAA
ncbi:MAG: hypothetical protein AAGB03_01825 [Pseudomonadota bacterium]